MKTAAALLFALVCITPARAAGLQLSAGPRDTRGISSFNVLTDPGSAVQLQISLDLQSWLGLDTSVATNGTAGFHDGLAQQAVARFYRAVPVASTNLPQPLSVSVARSAALHVTDTISRGGGGLILTNADGAVCLLDVPEGALAEPVAMTLTALSGVSGLPGDGKLVHGFVLEPAGVGFGASVRLRITPPAAKPLSTTTLGAVGTIDGAEFHLQPIRRTNGAVEFTWITTGTATLLDGGATLRTGFGDHPPTSLFARREQESVLTSAASSPSNKSAKPAGPAPAPLTRDEAIAAATADYTAEVLPALQLAGQDDDFLPAAVARVLNWNISLSYRSLVPADVAPIIDNIQELIRDAFNAGVIRAVKQCARHDLESLGHLVRLERYFGFPVIQDAIPPALRELLEGKIRSCASFDLSFKSRSIFFSDTATFTSMVETHVPILLGLHEPGVFDGERELPFTLLESTGIDCPVTTHSTAGFLSVEDLLLGINLEGGIRPQPPAPPHQRLDLRFLAGSPTEEFRFVCSGISVAPLGPWWILLFGGAYGDHLKTSDGITAYSFTGWQPGADDIIATFSEDLTVKSEGKTLGTLHTEMELRHTPGE